jgi:hypothetical protein
LKTKLLVVLCLLSSKYLIGQTINRVEVHGFVYAANDVESVAIYNKSSNKGTTTNKTGEFYLEVAEHDLVVISALQFETQTVTITKTIVESKSLQIYLNERVTQLSEVIVGQTLTGDLPKDINAIKGKPPINFYNLGIPGYTGKVATQSERRLAQAGEFKPSMLPGIISGGGSFDPIRNGISGRTKMLKQRVNVEERETLMQSIKGRMAKDFFESHPLENHLRMDFFYFCADDEHFIETCKNQTDFEIFQFLKMKYEQYMKNLTEIKD